MNSVDETIRALATPVQFLKGGGPQRAALLEKLKLRTARDLIFFFPRTYEDLSEVLAIRDLKAGESASVCGIVEDCDLREFGGRSVFKLLLRDGADFLHCSWFNQAYLAAKYRAGQKLLISGAPKRRAGRWEMNHPRVELLAQDGEPPRGRVLPVYPLTEGVQQSQMRRLIHSAVDEYSEMLDEVFPEPFLQTKELMGIGETIREVHAPRSKDSLAKAQRRLIYQELLVLQLALAIRRQRMTASPAPVLEVTPKLDARIRRRFPFRLTEDQDAAVRDIVNDLAKPHPMNRLVQGEVGSGKTVVAEYAMLAAVAVGRQAILMAPTDVLARQHEKTLLRDLAESQVRIGLLTGSLTAAQRRKLVADVQAGEIDIVVGTQAIAQALASGELQAPNLGLVIIDEQHKFGVRQRAELKKVGVDAHYLVMTATPIPRTISISLFGDLDVSALRNAPPGRQFVRTYIADETQRDKWWEFFRRKLDEGRQGYVVTPLIDDSDDSDVVSLRQAFEELAADRLESYRVDLIHGRMSGREKAQAMEKFHQGETQVLAATSVVEVGVDVPNATVMTIENGERYGLAQLHQLRGRISRGACPGYLCVFANVENPEAEERLKAFAKTSDGFELAEIDFRLRGPGDIFGVRQHGLPPFRIADLQRDTELLHEAHQDARKLVEEDAELQAEPWAKIREMVFRRFGDALELGDVG